MQVLDVLRTERKYPMTYASARRIAFLLSNVMRTDSHGDFVDGYQVRSVYFDSFLDQDFYEKEDGLEYRKKIRLRSYGPDSVVKLEWKEKQNNQQRKRSLLIGRTEAQEMLKGNYCCLKRMPEPLAMEFYEVMMTQTYRPRCLVMYDRLAFLEDLNDTRITFDSHISVHEGCFDLFSQNPPSYPVIPGDCVTMEVKYNGFLPGYIKDIISFDAVPQVSFGKYCVSRKYGLGGIDL
mgnify:FL=1